VSSDLKKGRQEFSSRLLIALAELGYHSNEQNALGKLFGVSGQAVKKWINGESTPSTARMPAIASTLGVRRAWLFDGEGAMREISVTRIEESKAEYLPSSQSLSISQDESDLLYFYRRLPEPVRTTFKELLEQYAQVDNSK